MTEESNLMTDASWAREACAFVIFVYNLVSNFVASELMLISCATVLRYYVLLYLMSFLLL